MFLRVYNLRRVRIAQSVKRRAYTLYNCVIVIRFRTEDRDIALLQNIHNGHGNSGCFAGGEAAGA